MLSRKDVSKLLNVSVSSIIRMEKKGLLTPIKYTGDKSKVYFKPEEVDKLINNRNSQVVL